MTRRPASDRRDARRARRAWPAIAGYGALALACLCLAVVAFLLVAPPLDGVRDRLAAEVNARTGRTLTASGPMSVTLFPRVVVALSDVALLPPEGMEGAPTLTAPSLEVETSLWSLLSRRPKLGLVTLHRPTIELAVDAQGRRSWEAAIARKRAAHPLADAAASTQRTTSGPAGVQASSRPRQPRPWAVRIVDGTLRYRDARTGTHYEIGALDLRVAADDAAGPAAIDGAFVWEGVPFHLSATASAGVIGQGRRGQVALTLAGAPLEVAYEGMLGLQDGVSAGGTLTVRHATYKDLKLGPATFDASVAAGVGKLTLREGEFYGGRGEGGLTLDTSGATPAIAARLKLSDVSVQPLLKAAAGVGWLDGRGTVALDLDGQGLSQRRIAETLHGKAEVRVAEGAVTGIDIDRTMRALQRGRLDRLAPRREDRTPFSALAATFEIADGVAKSRDMKLDSAHVSLQGEGQIELGARRIDTTLQAKVTGADSDEGAAVKIGTLQFPLTISGPLDRPKFSIAGQEGVTDAIRQIGKNLRSREMQDAIGDLLSGNEKRVKPGELIEKLLKKE
jgi:uncharacterized protein involved in outer membrane biogenesis